jgi:hypothetical protein
MATDAEIAAGLSALSVYLGTALGWEASFIPEYAEQDAVTDVITAADAAADQSAGGRQQAGVMALRTGLNNAGYGSEVTDQMCADAVQTILAAIAQVRNPTTGA